MMTVLPAARAYRIPRMKRGTGPFLLGGLVVVVEGREWKGGGDEPGDDREDHTERFVDDHCLAAWYCELGVWKVGVWIY